MRPISQLGNQVFEWVLQSTWQSAVLAGLILLAQLILHKRLTATRRYGLWLLLVVRLAMPVFPESSFSIFNLGKIQTPGKRVGGPPAVARLKPTPPPAPITSIFPSDSLPSTVQPDEAEHREALQTPSQAAPMAGIQVAEPIKPKRETNWSTIAFRVWLTGVCLLGLRLAWTNFRFLSRIRRHQPVSGESAVRLFDTCRASLDVRDRVTLIETEEVRGPAVYGLFHKRLLLPDGIFERFSNEELRYIFLHELAHIRRRDLEVNWLVSVLHLLHWFNPVLWFAFARMRVDRELATDAFALAHTRDNENTPYGETILKVLETISGKPTIQGLVGIMEDKERIKERLTSIARHGAVKPWKGLTMAVVALLSCVALTDARKESSLTQTTASKPSASILPTIGSSAPASPNQSRLALRLAEFDTGAVLNRSMVQFEMEYATGGFRMRHRVTDTNGEASIEIDPQNLERLTWRTIDTNYLSLRGEWIKQEIALMPKLLEVRMSKGTEIGGKVVDKDGNPFGGAEIFFDRTVKMILTEYVPNRVTWTPRAGTLLAVTATDGSWKAQCIWPSAKWATLRIRHQNFADVVYSTEITKGMGPEGDGKSFEFEEVVQKRARFSLDAGHSVAGKVVDQAGIPVPGVRVRHAERQSDRFWSLPGGKNYVTSDEKGTFRIEHLPEKIILFTTQHAGFAPTVGELNLTANEREIEIRLKPGQKLVGLVLGKDGLPVSGARVSLDSALTWPGAWFEALSDTEGRFQWDTPPAEKYRLLVEKRGFINQRVTLEGGGERTITLNPTLHLTGTVRDSETQKPIEQFTILWAENVERLGWNKQFGIAGSNGVYSLDLGSLHSDQHSESYPGSFVLRIEARGYLPATSRMFQPRQGDVGEVSYNLELTRAAGVMGIIQNANGKKVAGAQVDLLKPLGHVHLDAKYGKPRLNGPPYIIFPSSDDQGRFLIPTEPEATHLIAVHDEGIAVVAIKDLSANPIVSLQPWARIEGMAQAYDRALPNEDIRLQSLLVMNSPLGRFGIGSFSHFVQFNAKSDSTGKFSFNFVPPSHCRVYRMIPTGGGSTSGPAETAYAKPGETTLIKLGGSGRPITGRFKVKNHSVPIAWKNPNDRHRVISVMPTQPGEIQTEKTYREWIERPEIRRSFEKMRTHPVQFSEDGSFRIEEVAPGKYQFSLRFLDPRDTIGDAQQRLIATFEEVFEVPDRPDKNSREPFDIGIFELALNPQNE